MLFRRATNCGAFTLIEILVSIIILAVVFLGFSSLQANLLTMSHDTQFRNIASRLSTNMVERIYANAPGVTAGSYNNPTGSETANSSCLGLDGTGSSNNSSCTPAEMAAHDFFEWHGMISGSAALPWTPAVTRMLPNGGGIVCIDSTPNDGSAAAVACDNTTPAGSPTIYAIKLFWRERFDSTEHRYVEVFQPE